jgi:plastocyanin
MKTSTMFWIFFVVLILLGAGWYVWSNNSYAPATQISTTTNANTTAHPNAATSSASMSAMVMYDGTSFSPTSVTIARGGTVTWMDTSGTMLIASDPQPLNNGYDETTQSQHCVAGYTGPTPFDACTPGTQFTFTFDKTGSWSYHDAFNGVVGGTVIVQ